MNIFGPVLFGNPLFKFSDLFNHLAKDIADARQVLRLNPCLKFVVQDVKNVKIHVVLQ